MILLILMVIAAITLFAFGVTRAVHRDWRVSLICLAAGAILFVLSINHSRQFGAAVKVRAKEYGQMHPKVAGETTRIEMTHSSNNGVVRTR